MVVENSFTNKTSAFCSKPMNLASQLLNAKNSDVSNEKTVIADLSVSALALVQTIASIAAVPIQILAGIFSCLYLFSKGDFVEGDSEFTNGFKTSGEHIIILLTAPIISVGAALLCMIHLPYCLCTWNMRSEPVASDLSERVVASPPEKNRIPPSSENQGVIVEVNWAES